VSLSLRKPAPCTDTILILFGVALRQKCGHGSCRAGYAHVAVDEKMCPFALAHTFVEEAPERQKGFGMLSGGQNSFWCGLVPGRPRAGGPATRWQDPGSSMRNLGN